MSEIGTPAAAVARLGERAGEAPAAEARPLRFVTAASLFDGHDASINIVRRLLQEQGAEVIHLGHDRSVHDVVVAAVQEDAQGVAVSSYQGGHLEYFRFLVDELRARGCGHVRVFGGGGGVIVPHEIDELHAAGVERIYSVADGRTLGLLGMVRDMMQRAEAARRPAEDRLPGGLSEGDPAAVARALTLVEDGAPLRGELQRIAREDPPPVVGFTGTGGAGKSSLVDELVRRFLERFPGRRIAVLAVDPSRRRTGGALLADRIRMNTAHDERVFVRSMATRRAHLGTSTAVPDALAVLRAAPFDLVVLETAGVGQASSEVVDLCDVSVYVMTPEFGAPSQLEKIDMLDLADLVVLNKADKRGAEDGLREVRRQVRRLRNRHAEPAERMPVHLACASRFGDVGVDEVFEALARTIRERHPAGAWDPGPRPERNPHAFTVVPEHRVRYLAEIAETVRAYRAETERQAARARRIEGLGEAIAELREAVGAGDDTATATRLAERRDALLADLDPEVRRGLEGMEELRARYAGDTTTLVVRGRATTYPSHETTLSGTRVPKVAVPRLTGAADRVRWLRAENVPGAFPFTAGVFPFKRTNEDPTRMFAGEGTPERTNRRFHFVSRGQPAVRLSTAFDSVTLYGADPAERPDVWGKIGNSGVSVATLDDAKRLYSGFDLLCPSTSVSMTINGPAPTVLAFFLNTAIDQAVEQRLKDSGRWEGVRERLARTSPPGYRGALPDGHDGTGLGLLGTSGDAWVPAEEYAAIRDAVVRSVRGTVQADILKEDQAQNTCIFSTDFALKVMGDVEEWFVRNRVRNFYSVSVSGYHMAEAGANPITQLAFTLANGFTYVEYYRARGLDVSTFAPHLSFFFSNGLDAEYAVIGRVARRIWAIALKHLYGADERAQQLKYHIQTSGRSLHAQEIAFNDIRTTLQALYAIYDNCQSLHTNAYDEAITTPTEESVRRALAIQLIVNRELGLAKNENPLAGSYVVSELTDLVEEAVCAEFERLSTRGGVLGAMEAMYQRGRIQDESLRYEMLKDSGELPIVGVNTFVDPRSGGAPDEVSELIRSTEAEKKSQVEAVRAFQARHAPAAGPALERLRRVAEGGGNVFAELLEAVKVASLGQISSVLYRVGGQYRRST